MPSFADPKTFIADFYRSFNEQLLASDEDASAVVDRFHAPDIVQFADGHRIDRDKLIAHCRPVRKNRPEARIEVYDAVADGDSIAARYAMHVRQRGKDLAIEVYFFGRFTEDGRMREAHMLTRTARTAAES
ncbi:nuclear transport factor 2 family protein [Nocardia sp. NPDC127579]|uniref:nuclear transport factor 2 family protein n=1 Tax=Nocardia sp. NPDC127579 TaxID=3345402 RepID=UPI003624D071